MRIEWIRASVIVEAEISKGDLCDKKFANAETVYMNLYYCLIAAVFQAFIITAAEREQESPCHNDTYLSVAD